MSDDHEHMHRNPFINLPTDSAGLQALRETFVVADCLTILGWPVVLNPCVRDFMTVCIGIDNPLCITGGNEVQMSPAHLTRLALPAQMALVERNVAHLQSILRNLYVVLEFAGDLYYAQPDGTVGARKTAWMTNTPARAEAFRTHVQQFTIPASARWSIKSEPWNTPR
jgi:hypothetical protein